MPQDKTLAQIALVVSLVVLCGAIYFLAFTDALITGIVTLLGAGVVFFLGIAMMPGQRSEGSSTVDEWGPTHSDWDSTD